MEAFQIGFLRLFTVFTLSSYLLSCASTPPFTPSKPLEAAKTPQEGLFLCNEYKISPQNARRIAALKPYLNCLDDLSERFNHFQEIPQIRDFQQELQSRFDLLDDSYWNERLASQFELAIHAALRGLWRPKQIPPTYTWPEKNALTDIFPKTANHLSTSELKISASREVDPKFEKLLFQEGVFPDSQKWAKLLRLRRELQILHDLAPNSPEAAHTEKRYAQELSILSHRQ